MRLTSYPLRSVRSLQHSERPLIHNLYSVLTSLMTHLRIDKGAQFKNECPEMRLKNGFEKAFEINPIHSIQT